MPRSRGIVCLYTGSIKRTREKPITINLLVLNYTDTDCVFYTDGMNMVLHGTKDGVATLSLPRKAIVYDVVTDKAVTTEAVDKLEVPLKFAETRILRF